MLDKILAVEGYPKYIEPSEAIIYAVLGWLIVFLGICFLIGVVVLVGHLMKKANGKQAGEVNQKIKEEKPKENVASVQAESEAIPEEVVAVITAAIMAYYEQNNPKCEFTVRRIKKI